MNDTGDSNDAQLKLEVEIDLTINKLDATIAYLKELRGQTSRGLAENVAAGLAALTIKTLQDTHNGKLPPSYPIPYSEFAEWFKPIRNDNLDIEFLPAASSTSRANACERPNLPANPSPHPSG